MISIIIAIAVVGFLCWLVTLIPMPPVFRQVIWGLAALMLVIYVLHGFGFVGSGWRWRD
jgi:VIT1/CCC1 family predicted Fe2+/Mn2+ transporter